MTSTRTALERDELSLRYHGVRAATEALCRPLQVEDMVVQTIPDVSPTKWHLGHVTWFFETFVLAPYASGYASIDERYHALFNSYYESVGEPFPRGRRGHLSRPGVDEVLAYRRHVDEAVGELLAEASEELLERIAPVVEVGLNHEEQHQELLLMDVKHVLACNPLRPAYRGDLPAERAAGESPVEWRSFAGGTVDVGHGGPAFSYDNERPRHEVRLRPFELATRPVTAGEYLAFLRDGGYEEPAHWLADGFGVCQREQWRAPLYWEERDGGFMVMTLAGLRELLPEEPVCHVSYYEADAFARWAGCRLPTEFEWEHAAGGQAIGGTFLESGAFHPRPAAPSGEHGALCQLFGDVWEWTSSPYSAYPGFEPFHGALQEYNGKFMINQMVLRGGCCVTPARHVRATYRNFYYPRQRWMFSGFRLAR